MLAFLSHIVKDEQLDRNHENYCGFVNVGSDFVGSLATELYKGYVTFVENYEKDKSKLDALLKHEGVKVQKVAIDETIFEVDCKIAYPNMIIGQAFHKNEQITLYSTNSEYVVVHRKIMNGQFTTEFSSTFNNIGEAHYQYQLLAEPLEEKGREYNLIDGNEIEIPESEMM